MLSVQVIEHRIYFIRGQKVMLDSDLAALYRVTTKRLNEQVRRNIKRFPHDFMLQLDSAECVSLRSQFQVNIAIMRTFVKLRQTLTNPKELAERLLELENRCDENFKIVFKTIRELIEAPSNAPRGRIGFRAAAKS